MQVFVDGPWFEVIVLIFTIVLLYFARHQTKNGTDKKKDVLQASGSNQYNMVDYVIDLCQRRHCHKAIEVFMEMQMDGSDKNINKLCCESNNNQTSFYVALVQAYLRTNQIPGVFKIIEHMRSVNVARTYDFYESAMRLLASHHFHSEALKMYDELVVDKIEPKPVMLSCLVNFATESNDISSAKRFFGVLKKVGTPSIRACMIMMRIFQRENDVDAAEELIYEMDSTIGVSVDQLVVNFTLSILVNQGCLDRAKKVSMHFCHLIDIVSYNTLLKGYARAIRPDEMMRFMSEIEERGVQPNLITYNTAVDGLVRASRADEALKLVQSLKEKGMNPDKFTCSIIVKGINTATEPSYLNTCFLMVKQLGPPLDDSQVRLHSNLYQSLLDATWKFSDARMAEEVLLIMRANTPRAVTPDTYGAVVAIAANNKDIPRCINVWHNMCEDGVKPNSTTGRILFDVFSRSNSPRSREARISLHKQWRR